MEEKGLKIATMSLLRKILGKINEVQNGMKLRVQGKMANTERIPNLN